MRVHNMFTKLFGGKFSYQGFQDHGRVCGEVLQSLEVKEANRRAGHSRSRSRTPKRDQPQEGKGGEKTDGDNEKKENRNEAGL